MMNKYHCLNCGKLNEITNYCNWNCHIEVAKKDGGIEICPNGLPIKCIRADGAMMEHPHADVIGYKFPVTVEYRGIIPADLEEWDCSYYSQVHAFLYLDGVNITTIYECCYYTFNLESGKIISDKYWEKDWYIDDESLKKIRGYTD